MSRDHARRMWCTIVPEWMIDTCSKSSCVCGLIDFFAPVRWDFSNVDGMVVNRGEYPMLAAKPRSYAGVTTVYAADDPRAALNRMNQRA